MKYGFVGSAATRRSRRCWMARYKPGRCYDLAEKRRSRNNCVSSGVWSVKCLISLPSKNSHLKYWQRIRSSFCKCTWVALNRLPSVPMLLVSLQFRKKKAIRSVNLFYLLPPLLLLMYVIRAKTRNYYKACVKTEYL